MRDGSLYVDGQVGYQEFPRENRQRERDKRSLFMHYPLRWLSLVFAGQHVLSLVNLKRPVTTYNLTERSLAGIGWTLPPEPCRAPSLVPRFDISRAHFASRQKHPPKPSPSKLALIRNLASPTRAPLSPTRRPRIDEPAGRCGSGCAAGSERRKRAHGTCNMKDEIGRTDSSGRSPRCIRFVLLHVPCRDRDVGARYSPPPHNPP